MVTLRRSNARTSRRPASSSFWSRLFKPRAPVRTVFPRAPVRTMFQRAPVRAMFQRAPAAPVRFPRGKRLSRADQAFYNSHGRMRTSQNRQNNKNARGEWYREYERKEAAKHYGQGWY